MVCEKLLNEFPQQHMVNGGSLVFELARLGRVFVPGMHAEDNDHKAAKAFVEHLDKTTHWLLLIDDVDPKHIAGHDAVLELPKTGVNANVETCVQMCGEDR